MMLLVWTKSLTGVYPVLWFSPLPTKGEGEPDSLNKIVQHDRLTAEQETAIDSLPAGLSKVDKAVEFYPLRSTKNSDEAVDSLLTLSEIWGAIDVAVDDYRRRMRKHDGQTAQIDRENGL